MPLIAFSGFELELYTKCQNPTFTKSCLRKSLQACLQTCVQTCEQTCVHTCFKICLIKCVLHNCVPTCSHTCLHPCSHPCSHTCLPPSLHTCFMLSFTCVYTHGSHMFTQSFLTYICNFSTHVDIQFDTHGVGEHMFTQIF